MLDETIVQLVFVDAISSQIEFGELAGQGMGLTTVLSETRQRGGGWDGQCRNRWRNKALVHFSPVTG